MERVSGRFSLHRQVPVAVPFADSQLAARRPRSQRFKLRVGLPGE